VVRNQKLHRSVVNVAEVAAFCVGSRRSCKLMTRLGGLSLGRVTGKTHLVWAGCIRPEGEAKATQTRVGVEAEAVLFLVWRVVPLPRDRPRSGQGLSVVATAKPLGATTVKPLIQNQKS
jgi:hypothetical protein